MRSESHLLFSMNLLMLLFGPSMPFSHLLIFSFIFAVLPDLDFLIRRYALKHKDKDLRTWLQEPFGIAFIGIPLAIIAGVMISPVNAALVLIPYASHVFIDYITMHRVRPLSPFSKKQITVGFIQPAHNPCKFKARLHEHHFLALNMVGFVVLLLVNR
ncbi:MAG: metal-dependent hydrolase [archaeon]